jgi:biopolymer transport protein ExbD
MTKTKEKWLEASFLSEVITGTVLALWIVFTELTRLDVYFSVAIGIILYIIFMVSLIFRKSALDKLQLATLKAQLGSEEIKVFTEKVQAQSSLRYTDLQIRKDTVDKVIRILEETLKDDKLQQDKKDTYQEIIRRLKRFRKSLFTFLSFRSILD